MGFQIEDGKGTGYAAGVGTDNRLLVSSINETIFQYAAEEGEAYFLGTPLVTLTNAAESAVFFYSHNEDSPLIVENFFTTATTTDGTPTMLAVNFYKNPTSLDTPTATTPLNQNFGSSNSLDGTLQYGAQGAAFVGGTLVATLYVPVGQYNVIPANLVLQKGNSFGISITPPTSNTSMPVQFGARSIVYEEKY